MTDKNLSKKAYDFSLTDEKGETIRLSSLKGKKVYIKFWATWCPMCLSGLKDLISLSAAHKNDSDTKILSIIATDTSREMSAGEFLSWYESQKFEFAALLDTGGEVTRKYGVTTLPTSVFIDKDGNISAFRARHTDNDTIEDILSDLHG